MNAEEAQARVAEAIRSAREDPPLKFLAAVLLHVMEVSLASEDVPPEVSARLRNLAP